MAGMIEELFHNKYNISTFSRITEIAMGTKKACEYAIPEFYLKPVKITKHTEMSSLNCSIGVLKNHYCSLQIVTRE